MGRAAAQAGHGGEGEQQSTNRTNLCVCLSETLAPQITTADADMLATDLDGTATEQSRSDYPTYPSLSGMAGEVFDRCSTGIVTVD